MSRQRFMYIGIITVLILLLVVPAASAQVPPDFWGLMGNSGTTSGTHFLGTTDGQALELHVNGERALRIEPNATGTSPNVIGGIASNSVSAGVDGATIGGGGTNGAPNIVTGRFGVVSGGVNNQAQGAVSTVSGGAFNTASGNFAAVGGGRDNETTADFAAIGGGQNNLATALHSTVGGGESNAASADLATVSGGQDNSASSPEATASGGRGNTASGQSSTVGGGQGNAASGSLATISGGHDNIADAEGATIAGGGVVAVGVEVFGGNLVTDVAGTISGGSGNLAGSDDGDPINAVHATVGGGLENTASAHNATVGGGEGNTASGFAGTVSGGHDNIAQGEAATIGGGGSLAGDHATGNSVTDDHGTVSGGSNNQAGNADGNPASAAFATVGGGQNNIASGLWTTVGGGQNNTASGRWATVPGGRDNVAAADLSFAGGANSSVDPLDVSTILFDAGNGGVLSSARANEFAVLASGGLRFLSGMAVSNSAGAGGTKEVASAGTTDLTWTQDSGNRKAHVLAAFATDGLNPIAFDSSSSDAETLQGSTLTLSHTIGNDANRMLVVGVEAESDYTVGCGVGSITYGGVPLTMADATVVGTTYLQCVELWYLIAPNVGSDDLVVTWNGDVDNRNGGAISISNTAQQAPEATADNVIESGTSITTSITTLTDGAWVVDAVGSGNEGTDFVTGEAGQIERYDVVGMTDATITTGCNLPPGSGTWECTSDRNAKVNFTNVNALDVLELVSQLPIESWNYRTEDPSIRHIGPMAQDFYAAFGLGVDDRHIGTIDADGVALAAIQGLNGVVNEVIEEKDAEIAALSDRMAALEVSKTSAWVWPVSLSGQIAWLAFGLMTIAAVMGWTLHRRRVGDRE